MVETNWEIIVLTTSMPLDLCFTLYKCHQRMLDTANRLFPSTLRNRGKISTQKSTKRLPEDAKHSTPEILISNSSWSTIIREEGNINSNLLTTAPPQNHKTDGLAIKLNRLKGKSARYNSHRFFVKMYTGKPCPKGTRNHT